VVFHFITKKDRVLNKVKSIVDKYTISDIEKMADTMGLHKWQERFRSSLISTIANKVLNEEEKELIAKKLNNLIPRAMDKDMKEEARKRLDRLFDGFDNSDHDNFTDYLEEGRDGRDKNKTNSDLKQKELF